MNLSKLRKILKDVLIRSCNTDQISYLGRETDPDFDLKEISGFGNHVVISKQVAADTVIDYFATESELLNFITTLYQYEGKGISGGIVHVKDKHKLDKFLQENDLEYNPDLKKFVVSQKVHKKKDWGFLEEGSEYRLAFVSIDIVGSSELVKTNVKVDIEATLKNFRKFVSNITEQFNGRIWQWFGDGGLVVFLNESGVSAAIRSSLQILYTLPIFNLTKNQLRWENRISVRLAIHFGSAVYRDNVDLIESEDIHLTKLLEHNHGIINAIVISETALNLGEHELRKFFDEYTQLREMKLYRSKFL